jgi:hypothetical protein
MIRTGWEAFHPVVSRIPRNYNRIATREENSMTATSAALADFTANSGDTIQFTFTPQPNGFAFLAGASLTVLSTTPKTTTALTVVSNQISFKLPQGDSRVRIVIIDEPDPEQGSLSYTVNGGASIDLWTNRPLSHMPGAFYGYGS